MKRWCYRKGISREEEGIYYYARPVDDSFKSSSSWKYFGKVRGFDDRKKLLPSKERYREHWKQDLRFEDSIAWGIGFDAGGRSFKGLMRCINVEKPHSQRHVLPILEFGGVKDTDHNVRKAAFMEGDIVRKGIESIISRRCILIKITIGGQIRVILVIKKIYSWQRCSKSASPELIRIYSAYTNTTTFSCCQIWGEDDWDGCRKSPNS